MFERFFFKLEPENEGGSASGGAQNANGGAGGGQNQNSGDGNGGGTGGAGEGDKVIKKEDHDRALADLHKFKTEAKNKADELTKIQEDLRKLKENGLKSNNDYKTYSEALEKERDDLKAERDQLKSGIKETFKSLEMKSAAQKLGITEQGLRDLDLLKFDDVEVEFTTGGRAIVHGADSAAELLKKTRPHWFTSGSAANINTGGKGNQNVPGELTAAYMNDLEKKDPVKYRELYPKFAKQAAARRGR